MNIHFFERKYLEGYISIEKLFDILKGELERKGHVVTKFKNPYSLTRFYSSWLYFRRNQNEINHITGDIHWVSLMLNPNTTILTIHDLVGLNYLTGIRKKSYYYFWLYFPLKRLKYITVISEKTKEELVSLFPWAANKIQVIPNFLTINPPEKIDSKRNPKPNVLIIGTRSNKNIETAFEALVGLDVKLNIVGALTESQSEFLLQNSIEYQLFFNLPEEALIELYKKTDVLLFPSIYEGFGLPILEAQAYGCVVITSDVSPMKDVAGKGAILVNPMSVLEIRQALIELNDNEEFKKELIEEGLKNIQNYSPSLIAQKYLDLYKRVLNAQRK